MGQTPADGYKARLRAFRTRAFLRASGDLIGPDIDRLDEMTVTELAAAAVNPDHSEAGRRRAEQMLRARGGDLDAAAVSVPGFVKPAEPKALRRMFFGPARSVRRWSGAGVLLALLGLFAAAAVNIEAEDAAFRQAYEADLISYEDFVDRGRRLTAEEIAAADPALLETFASETRLEDLLRPRVADTPAGRRAVLAETVGYAVAAAFSVLLIVWFATTALRRQPARVLVLRKFNDKKLARSMAMVIEDQLRPFGHVVTLSDKHIRRSAFGWLKHLIPTNFAHAALLVVWIPWRIVRRQFNRAKNGPAHVGSARDFRHLAKRLRERTGLNLEVALSSKEAVLVRSTDAWWRQVVLLLIRSADVVVADLSDPTDGTRWELDRLDGLGLFERAVTVAREDRAADARAAMDAYPPLRNAPLFVYDEIGEFADRDGFRTALIAAIARTAQAA